VKDFGVAPPLTGTVTATFTPASAVSGSMAGGGSVRPFNGTYLTGSTYDYSAGASLASIAGAWSLSGTDGSTATVSIGAAGAVTGTSSGCNFSGRLTPRANGKNVFDVTLANGPAPCAAPGATSTGVAVSYLIAGTALRQLVVVGTDASRTSGAAYFGTR
jgi:hypothetical protein